MTADFLRRMPSRFPDRIHFFGNCSYEREPQTYAYNSPYPSFNVDQVFTNRETWQAYRERRQQ